MKNRANLIKYNQPLIDLNIGLLRKNDTDSKKEVRKARKEISLNNKCISALEQGMDEDKLSNQLIDLKKKLKWIDSNFIIWKKSTPDINGVKNIRAKYDKEFNVPTIKKQIKFLRYILEV